MKILFFALLILLLLPLPALAETYRVFDKDHNVVEIWREKDDLIEVYNKDWSRKGYIKKEGNRLERYDKTWKREGRVEAPTVEEEPRPRR